MADYGEDGRCLYGISDISSVNQHVVDPTKGGDVLFCPTKSCYGVDKYICACAPKAMSDMGNEHTKTVHIAVGEYDPGNDWSPAMCVRECPRMCRKRRRRHAGRAQVPDRRSNDPRDAVSPP